MLTKIFFFLVVGLCLISGVVGGILPIKFAPKALIKNNQKKVINGKLRIIKKY